MGEERQVRTARAPSTRVAQKERIAPDFPAVAPAETEAGTRELRLDSILRQVLISLLAKRDFQIENELKNMDYQGKKVSKATGDIRILINSNFL